MNSKPKRSGQRLHQRSTTHSRGSLSGAKCSALQALLALVAVLTPFSLLVAFQGGSSANSESGAGTKSPASMYKAVLDQYCVSCHNEKLRTAGLVLTNVNLNDVSKDSALWEKVLDKLQTGAMPPAGVKRPQLSTYNAFSAYLVDTLDRSAAAHPRPGRPAVHRLNRAEYTNAIRDMLALNIDVAALLPGDDAGYGFDNIADVLSVSPTLLQRYMSAAGKVTRLALGDLSMKPETTIYRYDAFLGQDERMGEDLPFGSRGGAAIRYYAPVDGEYKVKARLERDGTHHDERIIGLGEDRHVEIGVDGVNLLKLDIPAATGANARRTVGGYLYTADDKLETTFSAKAGERLVTIDFPKESWVPEGILQPDMVGFRAYNRRPAEITPAVTLVTITGPHKIAGIGDTPSRQKIFSCQPGPKEPEIACAKKIIASLAKQAYRRPVTDSDLESLLTLYQQGKNSGGFEVGVSMAIQGLLVSPQFLFRVERDPPKGVPQVRLNDLEIASRLSFFLWSSIPDDELLNVAAAGKLKDPAVLEQQVRRMLADPRSRALVDNFAGQWLFLRNMRIAVPSEDQFPNFDENVREAFIQETNLFIDSNLREDRSVLNLLTADYTFLNERLARFYGIPNVYGNRFRRVSLEGHDERRGLLGQGSILTVTSYANRTAPTIRGKWLLSNLLDAPPPPPPPNVPSLKEEAGDGRPKTMRQRMEEHRANPACSVCHARMDPIGFALENFNAVGEWRDTSEGVKVDSFGVFPDGTKFNGPVELRKIITRDPERFAHTVTDKMMIYALGRGTEYYDGPAIRRITRDAAKTDYRWSSIILGIVKSDAFQMRGAKEL
jgi:hypothetical protein